MTSTRPRSEPALVPLPCDLAASPGDLAASPGDLAASPGDLAASPGDLAASPVEREDSPVEREDLRRRVSRALDDFLERQDARLAAVARETGELVLALRDLLHGGKRLRPAFAYWAWRGAGMPDDDRMVVAAAALELFQASAIIHDDVMDRSDIRRGRPAVHRRFAALHQEAGWRSDQEAFGSGAAILVGDLCLGWSGEMFSGSGLAPERLVLAGPIFDEMRTELMGGQYLDLLEQAVGGGSVARSRRVIRYKSARYSVLRPLQLGAALAGGSRRLRAAYDAYGLPLGEAFQLRDDLLGVFGDPAETGKPAGDDLREGKRTVLVALAMERGSKGQVRAMTRYLGDPALDRAGVEVLREVLLQTGAVAEVERMIAAGTEQALEALDTVEVAPPADEVLRELAAAATARCC